MSRKELISHIEDNFYQHAWKIPKQTSGMQVVHTNGLTYVKSGLSCDTFNIIHIHSCEELSEGTLSETLEKYRSAEMDFCVWVSKENLTENVQHSLDQNSLSQQNAEEGMVLNLQKYQVVENSKHDYIKIVDSKDTLLEYARVISENWNPPDKNVMEYYQSTSDHYLNPSNRITLLMYYHEGKAVSTVEMFPSDSDTIGLYGFATLASYRGLGIGTSLMTFALNKSKEQGYKRAILQASEDGIGIYRKFGFEELTTYFEFA